MILRSLGLSLKIASTGGLRWRVNSGYVLVSYCPLANPSAKPPAKRANPRHRAWTVACAAHRLLGILLLPIPGSKTMPNTNTAVRLLCSIAAAAALAAPRCARPTQTKLAAATADPAVASREAFDDVVQKTYGRYPVTIVRGLSLIHI